MESENLKQLGESQDHAFKKAGGSSIILGLAGGGKGKKYATRIPKEGSKESGNSVGGRALVSLILHKKAEGKGPGFLISMGEVIPFSVRRGVAREFHSFGMFVDCAFAPWGEGKGGDQSNPHNLGGARSEI